MAVLAKHSSEGRPEGGRQARGSEAQATRGSESEAGHNKRGSGTTREGRVLESVSTKLHRITEQAKRDSGFVFTNLMHLIDEPFLWEAHRLIRKDGASGVDGVTGRGYAEELEGNLRKLHERMRGGGYKAPPVKRSWVPKDGGERRPIGITAFEDKIVQKAVTMILEAIYEVDFHDVSYGFRPRRSAHGALKALRSNCYRVEVTELIDADIQGYFDTIKHEHLREFLQRRINDGALLRFINKWLRAGVMDGERLCYPKEGTPQGAVISPILANIYLHEVLDRWFQEQVKPVMYGNCFLIRYGDDFVLGFERPEDAQRVMKVLAKRFAKYGLGIHPKKTRRICFRPPENRGNGGESFDFLGFTHYWSRSRKGNWVIKRRTSKKRQRRALTRIWRWCRQQMHEPVREQWQRLVSKLRGHYNYYGIIGNYKQLEVYYEKVLEAWRFWLNRRSSKGQRSAERFQSTILRDCPLPSPRIMHQV